MNEIRWQTKAIKQLLKVGVKPIQQRIKNAVTEELTDLSQARNVKALKDHQYQYRLRVGNYRVLFNHEAIIEIISIEEVRKRDERTY